MDFGICTLSVVPLRTRPDDRSEMSTQLFFGDIVEVLDSKGSWLFIKNRMDGYEGWLDFKQLTLLDKTAYDSLAEKEFFVNRGNLLDQVVYKNENIYLPAGCSIYRDGENGFGINGEKVVFSGELSPFAFTNMDELLITARSYLSCPYLWGGKTLMGLDCSGFTQVVFKQHGIGLLRDASQQSSQGELINMLVDSAPGDLAFFDHEDGRISHVGILLDQTKIIHCSGKVRVDSIDHQGIFNQDLKKYTHSLRLIRRVNTEQ